MFNFRWPKNRLAERVEALAEEIARLKTLPELEAAIKEYDELGGEERAQVCGTVPKIYVYRYHWPAQYLTVTEFRKQHIDPIKLKIADRHLKECNQTETNKEK